jgi:hypothetical protein
VGRHLMHACIGCSGCCWQRAAWGHLGGMGPSGTGGSPQGFVELHGSLAEAPGGV